MADTAGVEPPDRSILVALDRPPVLVHQPVVERAGQHQIVQVRATAVAPPDDVVRFGEPPRAAPGEPAFPVSVSDLPDHPRRGLAREATEADDLPGTVLGHDLHPRVAEQAPHRVGMHGRPVLDLTAAGPGLEAVGPGVDHHRGPVRIRVLRPARRAEGHQRVGAPSLRVVFVFLTRHRRDPIGDPLDRPGHDRSLRGRKLRLETEPPAVVAPPPRQRAGTLGLEDLVASGLGPQIAAVTDRGARDLLRPADQIGLVLGRCEPRELDDLVEAEPAPREGAGEAWQSPERVPGRDPPPRLPVGDAVPHREPMRQVAGARVPPRRSAIGLGDQDEQPVLGPARPLVRRVQRLDQPSIAGRVRGVQLVEHLFEASRTRPGCL